MTDLFNEWCEDIDALCTLHGLDEVCATGEYLQDDLIEYFNDGMSPAEVLHEWRLENDSDNYEPQEYEWMGG